MIKQRKIEKRDDFYMVLKPIKYEEDFLHPEWEKNGRKYNCKGLVNLLKTDGEIEFILPDEIKQDVVNYKRVCFEKKRMHLKKDLKKYREFHRQAREQDY